MKFESQKIARLGAQEYHIERRLARGTVADVYLATLDDLPDYPVIVKLVRDDASLDPLRVAGLRREAEVLTILNQAEDPRWASLTALSCEHDTAKAYE